MVEKHKCNWSEVKPGEVFIVHKPTKAWEGIGMYQAPGTPLTIEAGYIRVFGQKQNLLVHPTNPNYEKLNYYGPKEPVKQEVEVVDPNDFTVAERVAAMSTTHINNMTGCDPEIFVMAGAKPRLLPAFKFLPTQKEVMQKVKPPRGTYSYDGTPTAAAYRDGFAAEYYTYPISCHSFLVDYIRAGLKKVLAAAQAHDKTAKLTMRNTFTISAATMNAATDDDVALGCMPSLNAYGNEPKLPDNGRAFKLRFTGGHVHLGMTPPSEKVAAEIVKGCDIAAAIPAVAIFANMDSPVRRQFYGRAGEFRIPKHGVEYRTLSNAWLTGPAITHLMLNLVRIGAKIGKNGYTKYFDLDPERVQEIINFCDVDGARKWLAKHDNLFQTLLCGDGVYITGNAGMKAWQKVTQGGVEEIYKDTEDVPKNWLFSDGWIGHSDGKKCDWGKMCRSMA